MTNVVNIIVILGVVAFIVSRQFRAQQINPNRRFWLVPIILAVVALRDPHVIDRTHEGAAVALLLGSVVLVLVMGLVWGWTVRLWRASDGSVWMKGTVATVGAWSGLIAMRVGLYGLGAALHVHQSSSALLLTLGALLLSRSLVVNWRARSLDGPQSLYPVA
ncbi:DUF1453 family protein [Kitasatospora viridis]|uniref:Uncharacterized protein DUF1453 n=1 Tax=Kitasatospora viridis TaxID=281105 RepID=A0A561UE23_9ACTN|nr:DUF1453 family protein [Kitasatospora viridis]TWF97585.1 uncharacterized protein DUF1453 [Kitasatospora viridis]